MKTLLRMLVPFCLLVFATKVFAAAYQASQSGNNLQIATPYGNKIYFGDWGFDSLHNYKIEIPLKDLRPPPSSGNGNAAANGSGANAQNSPDPSQDDDQLILQANQLYNQGKFNDSLKFVEEVLRRNPSNVRAWLMKGSLMHVMGQKDLARNAWQQAQKLDPSNTRLQKLLENYR